MDDIAANIPGLLRDSKRAAKTIYEQVFVDALTRLTAEAAERAARDMREAAAELIESTTWTQSPISERIQDWSELTGHRAEMAASIRALPTAAPESQKDKAE